MRKLMIFILCVICFNQSFGQNIRGGFGHAYFGTAVNLSPDIQRDLRVSSLLGSDLQLNRLGVFGGGGGYGLFGKRTMLGGSGLGYQVEDATTRGEASLSMGGGFINVGYVTTLRENIMAFPYIGVGGNGMKLKVKNGTNDEYFSIGDKSIAPGDEIELHSGGMSFEVGYGLKFLTFSIREKGAHGGLMVGLQAGTYIFTGIGDWHEVSTDDMIPSFSRAYSFSPYIRLTIGGGGFDVYED